MVKNPKLCEIQKKYNMLKDCMLNTQMTYLESWGKSESEICAFMQKYWFEILTSWSDLDLNSVKNKLWWIHNVKCPSLSISTCKMTQKTYVARHACDLYFLVSFCDLILTFSGLTFVLTHYHYQTFTSTLCDFELFAARLTDPRVQNVKVFFIFDLTLALHMTFILKC